MLNVLPENALAMLYGICHLESHPARERQLDQQHTANLPDARQQEIASDGPVVRSDHRLSNHVGRWEVDGAIRR